MSPPQTYVDLLRSQTVGLRESKNIPKRTTLACRGRNRRYNRSHNWNKRFDCAAPSPKFVSGARSASKGSFTSNTPCSPTLCICWRRYLFDDGLFRPGGAQECSRGLQSPEKSLINLWKAAQRRRKATQWQRFPSPLRGLDYVTHSESGD